MKLLQSLSLKSKNPRVWQVLLWNSEKPSCVTNIQPHGGEPSEAFLGSCLINDWNERYSLSTMGFGEHWLFSLRSMQLSNYLDCFSSRLYPVPAWHTGSSILPSLVSGIHSNGKTSYIIISSSGYSPHFHNFKFSFCHFHQMLLVSLVYSYIVLLFEIKI